MIREVSRVCLKGKLENVSHNFILKSLFAGYDKS